MERIELSKRMQNVLELVERAEKKNDHDAQYELGIFYSKIPGKEKEAFALFKKSSRRVIAAMYALGRCYEEDRVIGFNVIRVNGTTHEMTLLFDQLDLLGIDYEIVEDGMPKPLTELETPDFDSFVAFDIETSGSYGAANGDVPAEITEIGAVRVCGGRVTERKDWLCNPGRRIVPRIARLTGITDAMVADEPPVSDVIREFADFVGDFPLVGHNIKSSDLHYILKAAKKAGVAFSSPFFDTYLYAKKLKDRYGWKNVKLEYLSEIFGIEQSSAHRAWCDAEANAGVYFKLKELE